MWKCKTDWEDIPQNVDSDYLWVVEQLTGEFVFLFEPFQIFYNEHGIFKNLVYPPSLMGLSVIWHPNISNIAELFNFLTVSETF